MAANLVDYRVMVSILAANGLGPVLKTLAADVLGLGRRVDAIGSKFGQWKGGVLAAGSAVAGIGVGLGLWDMHLLKAGDKIIQVRQNLAEIRTSAAGIDRIYQAALRGTAMAPATDLATGFGIGRKIQGVFMDPTGIEAAAATPKAILASAVLQFAKIPGGPESLADMLKAGEMSGAFYTGTGVN